VYESAAAAAAVAAAAAGVVVAAADAMTALCRGCAVRSAATALRLAREQSLLTQALLEVNASIQKLQSNCSSNSFSP
jgi:hypothetical protein